MESEEPISHPPPAESHNLQTKTCDPMAALQNSATRMISGENSRQICSFTTDRGFTIGHPADELLLYRIPMDEDDSWQLCRLLTPRKKYCPGIITGALAFVAWNSRLISQCLLAIFHKNSTDEVLKPLRVELRVHSRDRVGICL